MSASRSLLARLFYAVAILCIAIWLSFVVAIVDAGRRDEAGMADAIVVLGAAQYEGRPSPVLKARLDHAASLWNRGFAPRMIVTGGRGVGDTTSEAAVGMRYLVQRGIPADSDLDGYGGADDEPIHGSSPAPVGGTIAPICINSERPVSHAASGDPLTATTYDSAAFADAHEPDFLTPRAAAQIRHGRVDQGTVRDHRGSELVVGANSS